ncbi:C4-dicarboxylic acid transporter DauA [Rheinheimera sp.]|uniref:C4-dicarboxylic acid transporter DauA n=1 Tax=Rheinheimera sp. TaxID=1869214 RepID=UPI003D270CD9
MSHRAHLFSLRIFHALREAAAEGYGFSELGKDILAGISVGIIAIPLAMALAIACGVPPQYGLYTAIIAGFLIPLCGGSRYSISGPTAAFIVILYPVVQKYGLGGLLLATMLSGGILVAMAVLRLGRFIQYIPEAVTLGFTAGIAVVIATLQLRDLFGLSVETMPEHYLEKLQVLLKAADTAHWPAMLVAAVTLWLMLLWPKLGSRVPPHLPAVITATLLALVLNHFGYPVETIGSRFHYTAADGSVAAGIPDMLPSLQWPWLLPGADGLPLKWSSELVKDLLTAAFAMAMLGAIESLLCAMVLDGMTGRRHSANSELLGQGIGNIVAPFFGGMTATAALARSAANVRAGAVSPVSGMVHAGVVLLALFALAPVLSYLPLAGMAALLLVVAWNMSEAPKALHLINTAPRSDVLVFAVCFSFTVLFDMVIAISCGIIIAALLFVREVAEMTKVSDVTENPKLVSEKLAPRHKVFRISGPLFFAAADRVFAELALLCKEQQQVVILMDGVTLLDAGGLAAFDKFLTSTSQHQCHVMLVDLQFQVLKTLAKAKVRPIDGLLSFYPTLADALRLIPKRETDHLAGFSALDNPGL